MFVGGLGFGDGNKRLKIVAKVLGKSYIKPDRLPERQAMHQRISRTRILTTMLHQSFDMANG